MSRANQPKAETDVLRDRLARLTRSSPRVGESLDLTAVLHGSAEYAYAVTGTRHGSTTAMEESGEMGEFVPLGFTPEEQRSLLGFRGARDLGQYLREHSRPGHLFRALSAHLRGRGFAGKLPDGFGHSHSLLAGQLRHRGNRGGRNAEEPLQLDQSLPDRRRSARPVPDPRPDCVGSLVLEYRQAARIGSL